jgi:hypothetical protein
MSRKGHVNACRNSRWERTKVESCYPLLAQSGPAPCANHKMPSRSCWAFGIADLVYKIRYKSMALKTRPKWSRGPGGGWRGRGGAAGLAGACCTSCVLRRSSERWGPVCRFIPIRPHAPHAGPCGSMLTPCGPMRPHPCQPHATPYDPMPTQCGPMPTPCEPHAAPCGPMRATQMSPPSFQLKVNWGALYLGPYWPANWRYWSPIALAYIGSRLNQSIRPTRFSSTGWWCCASASSSFSNRSAPRTHLRLHRHHKNLR